MQYDLSILTEWARRQGSDKLTRQRDTLVTDGTNEVTLSGTGHIVIQSVKLAGTPVSTGDYTLELNSIVFETTPPQGTQVTVLYDRASYSDLEVAEYLLDGLKMLMAELALFGWQINAADPDAPLVNDPSDRDITAENVMNQALETLLTLRAGINMRKELANAAGADAIMIKDGDTTIDTSKSAKGAETVLHRMQTEFDGLLRITIANRAKGVAIQNNWVPLPYPWSTPNMMPGEVNGPSY